MTGDSVLSVAGSVAAMLALGLLSGLVPLVNAEALLIVAVLHAPGHWPAVVLAVALGQSAAKVLIYLGARDGRNLVPSRWSHRPQSATGSHRAHEDRRSGVARRWSLTAERVSELVRRPVAGSALILASAIGGIPPLAATSVVAGLSRMRLSLFGVSCLTGRVLRFALIAIPVASWPFLGA